MAASLPDEMPFPCNCWSCDGQCAGSQDPSSCGPLTASNRGLICARCRDQVDVFDDDRTGLAVRLSRDETRVVLDSDVFGRHKTRLLPADARLLAARLVELASQAEADA